MSKAKIARKKRPPSTVPAAISGGFESLETLMGRVKAPLLTLDDVVLVSERGVADGQPELAITGGELADLLSLRQAYPSTGAIVDREDVYIRLRGLADLLHQDTSRELEEDAKYFIAETLDDLAARLETSPRTDAFRVGLLRPRTDKAVAS